MAENPWYQTLRSKWKPAKVRLLLIGESAPADHGDPANRRFFYSEPLSHADNLFRSVAAALYNSGKLTKGDSKQPWLERLRTDGVYLIDLAPEPVNALSGAARRSALRANVDDCVKRATELQPEGIIICHGPSFALLKNPLNAAGLPLLHDAPIPFPLGNTRAQFIEDVRSAIAKTRLKGLPPLFSKSRSDGFDTVAQ